MRILSRLLSYLKKYWYLALLALICMMIVTGLDLVVPWLIKEVIDYIIVGGRYRLLMFVALAVIGITVFKGILSFGQSYTMEYIAQRVIYDLRNALYNHLHMLSFSYYDQAQTGQLLSRATSDVDSVRRFVGFAVINLINNVLVFFGVLALLLRLDWKLTLLALGTMPFLVTVVLRFSGKVRPLFYQVRDQFGRLTSVLEESLMGVRVVKAFAREAYEIDKFSKENWRFLEKILSTVRLVAFYFPFMSFIAGLGTTLILWYGGREVILGYLTLGTLVAFNAYLIRLIAPVRMLGWLVNLLQSALASGQRIFEILDAKPEVEDAPDAIPLPQIEGRVKLEGVSFAYDEKSPVLKNVHFEVAPGETVALLGSTGSGKSTIINLIPRFYDPTSGKITLDGYDVKKVTLESLRRQIGMVSQETFLFAASIKENIAYGKPSAKMEEIVEAAKIAQIDDFIISLPDKYETEIGERGVTLSGGQKQRVAIARALLTDPKILILDDSTSSVDMETEYELQQALAALMKDRTVFVIAQRLSTVKRADKIIVIENGEIVEQGRHEELLANSGIYAQIYHLQFKDQELREQEKELLVSGG